MKKRIKMKPELFVGDSLKPGEVFGNLDEMKIRFSVRDAALPESGDMRDFPPKRSRMIIQEEIQLTKLLELFGLKLTNVEPLSAEEFLRIG